MAALSGCAVHQVREPVHANRLTPATLPALHCAWRLLNVVDARAHADAGQMGQTGFEFPDAAQQLATQLAQLQWSQAPDSPALRISIRQLYVRPVGMTRQAVLVYQLDLGESTPVLLRAQPTQMTWTYSRDAGYDSLDAAIDDANRQMVDALNARCGQRTTTQP